MIRMSSLLDYTKNKEPRNRSVYRLSTEAYRTKQGVAIYGKRLSLLKRKSTLGFDLLSDQMSIGDVDEVMSMIINLHKVPDGIYELVTCNHSADWESGMVEDYDLKLVEYKDNSNENN